MYWILCLRLYVSLILGSNNPSTSRNSFLEILRSRPHPLVKPIVQYRVGPDTCNHSIGHKYKFIDLSHLLKIINTRWRFIYHPFKTVTLTFFPLFEQSFFTNSLWLSGVKLYFSPQLFANVWLFIVLLWRPGFIHWQELPFVSSIKCGILYFRL